MVFLKAVQENFDVSHSPCRRVRAELDRFWKPTNADAGPPRRFADGNDGFDWRVGLGIADDVGQAEKPIAKQNVVFVHFFPSD